MIQPSSEKDVLYDVNNCFRTGYFVDVNLSRRVGLINCYFESFVTITKFY